MEKEVAALRARIENTGRGANGRRNFDEDVRHQAAALARRWVEDGGSVCSLAESLGVHQATLHYWVKSTKSTNVLRAVEIAQDEVEVAVTDGSPARLVAVLPSGIRIEGMQVADVIELARAIR